MGQACEVDMSLETKARTGGGRAGNHAGQSQQGGELGCRKRPKWSQNQGEDMMGLAELETVANLVTTME